MRLAADLAGFTLGEADTLRKAMGKKDRELMAAAAREVHRRLQGEQGRGAEGRARLGADREVRGLRLQQEPRRVLRRRRVPDGVLQGQLSGRVHGGAAHVGNGRTDKIVQYMDECRAMGLRVVPPDVNVSGAQFTVAGGTIRFGLAAIKNVGETAIESIVKRRRESGTFRVARGLLLARRPPPGQPAGAGEPDQGRRLRLPRGDAGGDCSAALDQAMEVGQRRQRERDEGPGVALRCARGRRRRRRCRRRTTTAGRARSGRTSSCSRYEKEVLGFYLSGHPLERYRDVARRLSGITCGRARRAAGRRARAAPRARSARCARARRRAATAWRSPRSKLVDGTVPITVFPEP